LLKWLLYQFVRKIEYKELSQDGHLARLHFSDLQVARLPVMADTIGAFTNKI